MFAIEKNKFQYHSLQTLLFSILQVPRYSFEKIILSGEKEPFNSRKNENKIYVVVFLYFLKHAISFLYDKDERLNFYMYVFSFKV